jgi:hypothetical protein
MLDLAFPAEAFALSDGHALRRLREPSGAGLI